MRKWGITIYRQILGSLGEIKRKRFKWTASLESVAEGGNSW